MDNNKMLAELRAELEHIEQAIIVLERVGHDWANVAADHRTWMTR
jgi:hypothetical protein